MVFSFGVWSADSVALSFQLSKRAFDFQRISLSGAHGTGLLVLFYEFPLHFTRRDYFQHDGTSFNGLEHVLKEPGISSSFSCCGWEMFLLGLFSFFDYRTAYMTMAKKRGIPQDMASASWLPF